MNIVPTTEHIPKKELILNTAGATRERGAKVIAEAMDATKMTVDKFGDEHIEPDHTTRLRAEELRAKYVGDIKPEGPTTYNTTIAITEEQFKKLLEDDRRKRPTGQTGEIIDVQNYRAS